MQPSENPKNPKNTPVDPLTSVGSTGDKENSSRAQNCFFSPQPLENLMIGGSNQVQRSSNFGEMKMMTSRTHPQKISTKFLTNKEESKEIGARAGFCEKLKNVKNKRARESRGFCTRQESMDSLQGAQRITTNLCSRTIKAETKINAKTSTQSMELIRNQKPGGHEEDRASFPNQSQYKVSRTIALKSTPMKGRRRTGRRKRRRQGEGAACLCARQRERE